ISYLRFTGRPEPLIQLVEAYMKEQGMFHSAATAEARYSDRLELDLASVVPSLAGPTRPQDRVSLLEAKEAFAEGLKVLLSKIKAKGGSAVVKAEKLTGCPVREAQPRHGRSGDLLEPDPLAATAKITLDGQTHQLHHGSVVIAAITSCTNTSNPSVMIAAGLLAK